MKNSKVINKSLKYSVIVKFVNFDPKNLEAKTIVVDGQLAIRVKGRIYTKV